MADGTSGADWPPQTCADATVRGVKNVRAIKVADDEWGLSYPVRVDDLRTSLMATDADLTDVRLANPQIPCRLCWALVPSHLRSKHLAWHNASGH